MSDFDLMLQESGFTADEARAQAAQTHDIKPVDLEKLWLEVKESPIEGLGLFAKVTFQTGEYIGPARVGKNRTQLGRYANHSGTPNAVPVLLGQNIYYVANQTISAGEEITIDYRESLKIRHMEVHRVEEPKGVQTFGDKMRSAENYLASLPQVDIPVKHTFGHGTYAREIMIPKGVTCSGKIHLFDDINIVQYGRMQVLTDGGQFVEVVGPCTFVAKAGVKKMGKALEDTLWITIHATDETDLDIIESTLFAECDGDPKVIDFKTGKPIQEALK